MTSPIEMVLTALNAAEVHYLVVGGVAVVLHGHLRTTAGLDLVVQLQSDNARRAIETLDRLGFRPRPPVRTSDFADEANRQCWIAEKGLTVLSFLSPQHVGFEVALFVSEPFDFDLVHSRGLRLRLDTTETTIPSLEDLISLKRSVDRLRDRLDIPALEALLAKRRGGGEDDGFDRGWEGHARRQATIGLDLSPAERLRWLEETMATMRRWVGRAQDGRPVDEG